jgi:hypothetical protein
MILEHGNMKKLENAIGAYFSFALQRAGLLVVGLVLVMSNVYAQDDDTLAKFARKAQDPLGDVKALMTDNTIAFDGGPNEDTSYSLRIACPRARRAVMTHSLSLAYHSISINRVSTF